MLCSLLCTNTLVSPNTAYSIPHILCKNRLYRKISLSAALSWENPPLCWRIVLWLLLFYHILDGFSSFFLLFFDFFRFFHRTHVVLCNPAVLLSDNPDCVCCTFCRIGAYAVHEEVLHMGVSRTRGSRSPGGQGMFVQYPGTCTAIFGSMTQTLHAQSSLAAASIRTAVTKISSAQTHGGCAYGLTFPCMQAGNVRQILTDAGIRVRQIFGEP